MFRKFAERLTSDCEVLEIDVTQPGHLEPK
jgi:hypothetical protein